MQNAEQPASPWKSRIFVIVFVAILSLIIYGFIWIVQSADEALPQTNEIISLEEMAAHIGSAGRGRVRVHGFQRPQRSRTGDRIAKWNAYCFRTSGMSFSIYPEKPDRSMPSLHWARPLRRRWKPWAFSPTASRP